MARIKNRVEEATKKEKKNNRKTITKKIRFEVFKRDNFACQYCGCSSPDVLLEIDHITPVSKGGDNNIVNLVTCCHECNSGKRATLLTDDSTVKVQKKQLDELNIRREQIKMMSLWREELLNLVETELDLLSDTIEKLTGCTVNDQGRRKLRLLVSRFGYQEVSESAVISIETYYKGNSESAEKAFNKLSGVLYCREKCKKNPELEHLWHAACILKKIWKDDRKNCMREVFSYYNSNIPAEIILIAAKESRYISDFREYLSDFKKDEMKSGRVK